MSDVAVELARVAEAYERPTLKLLRGSTAPAVVAILRACFDDKTHARERAWLEAAVENHLQTLRATGTERVPTGSGRDLCRAWMRGQWLERSEAAGQEVYSLTSHAQSALNLVRTISTDRSMLSEHRVATIANAARRFNAHANPDVAERARLLQDQIEQLTREREALLAGDEEMLEVTDDYLLEGYSEILGLVESLPEDFARVIESIAAMGETLTSDFQTGRLTPGQLVERYLGDADSLLRATREGRAYEGALDLIDDPVRFAELRADLSDLAAHPRSREILDRSDLTKLRGTIDVIRAGTSAVMARHQRVTARVREYVTTHDLEAQRRLDQVLLQLEAAFPAWMATTGPRTTSELTLPDRAKLESLPLRFWDADEDREPEALADTTPDAPAPTLSELAGAGGPSVRALRAALQAGDHVTLSEMFHALPEHLRRPVEIAGLLHLTVNEDNLDLTGAREVYLTRRADGTTRSLLAPSVSITRQEQP